MLRYRRGRRQRLATIARTSDISLRDARTRAGADLADIRAGNADPLDRRRAAREAPTVDGALDRFIDVHCPHRIAIGRLKTRTLNDYRAIARRHIRPRIGRLLVAEVTRRDIETLAASLPGPTRNKVLAVTSRLFNLVETWEWRPQNSNPVRGVERAREDPRDRTLTSSELASFGAALASLESDHPAPVAALRVATLTGLRISEVLGMKWGHLDLEARTVVLPTTKTGRRTHALSEPAATVLRGLPRINDNVFTTGRGSVTYKHLRTMFLRAADTAHLDDVRVHDLRRSLATRAASSGVGVYTLRDLFGWKSLAMPNRYVRRVGGAVIDAAEQLAVETAAAMNAEQPHCAHGSRSRGDDGGCATAAHPPNKGIPTP